MTFLLPPFQFGCLFFFSCVISVARTSNTMLNRNGERGHPCLVPDVSGKALFLSIEYDVGCQSLIYGLCYVQECSLYSHFAECFYQKWVLYLIKCFFWIYWYDHVIFVFAVIDVMYYVYWFANIVLSLHPWNESHLVMVYDLFNVLLDTVCQ